MATNDVNNKYGFRGLNTTAVKQLRHLFHRIDRGVAIDALKRMNTQEPDDFATAVKDAYTEKNLPESQEWINLLQWIGTPYDISPFTGGPAAR